MTGPDLDQLSRRKAPEPQADARERAMTAAMQAFDDAEKIRTPPKDRRRACVKAPSSTGYGALS